MVRLLARCVGAALLGTTAGIHAYLYADGYRQIPDIGRLFLLLVVAASILTLAVLAAPRRWLAGVAVLAALTETATVIGLAVTDERGLFGFRESSRATLFWPSAWVEVAGAVVLAGLAVASLGAVVNRTAARPVRWGWAGR